jgi:hypothetical protein
MEKVTKKGLETALNVIIRHGKGLGCEKCEFYSKKSECCYLIYCIYRLAERSELYLVAKSEAGDK